jgi:hypothetical protein
MAEIKIEKKNSIWPWIVGIIILAIIIYLLAFNDRNNNKTDDIDVDELSSLIVSQTLYAEDAYFI